MKDIEIKLQELKVRLMEFDKKNTEGHLMLQKTLESILFLQMYEQGYIPKHILENKMEETRRRYQYRW